MLFVLTCHGGGGGGAIVRCVLPMSRADAIQSTPRSLTLTRA